MMQRVIQFNSGITWIINELEPLPQDNTGWWLVEKMEPTGNVEGELQSRGKQLVNLGNVEGVSDD